MKKKSFWIIISLLLLSLYLNISLGDAKININSIIFSWFNSNIDINLIDKTILEDIRIPRALMAILIGAVLATSGTVMQAVFRNPLADPGLIGVSSGGAVGAIFFITILSNLNLKNSQLLSDFGMIAFPMIGSILATFLVFKLSQYNKRTNVATMLLIGLAINAIAGAIIGFATYMSNDDQLRTFTFWSLGSLGISNWKIIITLIPLCVAVIFLKICMRNIRNNK